MGFWAKLVKNIFRLGWGISVTKIVPTEFKSYCEILVFFFFFFLLGFQLHECRSSTFHEDAFQVQVMPEQKITHVRKLLLGD